MATTFFLVGLLWITVALGHFFVAGGASSRKQFREGIPDFWRKSASYAFPLNHAVRVIFIAAYVLWLFPMTRPFWGTAGGFFMLLLSGLARH